MVRFPAVARFNFLDFPENFKKIVSVCTEKRRNPRCSLAVEYIYIYINSEKTHSCKRFGQSLHQYNFSKSDGAYI